VRLQLSYDRLLDGDGDHSVNAIAGAELRMWNSKSNMSRLYGYDRKPIERLAGGLQYVLFLSIPSPVL